MKHLFAYLDVNGDGVLDKEEAERLPSLETLQIRIRRANAQRAVARSAIVEEGGQGAEEDRRGTHVAEANWTRTRTARCRSPN